MRFARDALSFRAVWRSSHEAFAGIRLDEADGALPRSTKDEEVAADIEDNYSLHVSIVTSEIIGLEVEIVVSASTKRTVMQRRGTLPCRAICGTTSAGSIAWRRPRNQSPPRSMLLRQILEGRSISCRKI
jgi:hypothetical protein